jgi:hypothetical protein
MRTIANTMRIALIASFACALVGCSTVSPKEAFFRQHPDQRSKYVQFDVASPEVIADFRRQAYDSELAILRGFCEHFPQYPDVTNYAGLVRLRVDQLHDGDKKFDQQLARDFDPKTDHLFYYGFRDGKNEEYGWLILRRDEIFKKYWISKGVTYEP